MSDQIRKNVAIISPLRPKDGRTQQDHILLADKLALLAVTKGRVAPLAAHAYYTRFLDDNDEQQRAAGMACGAAFILAADEVWVWDEFGITSGMKSDIHNAVEWLVPVLYVSRGQIPCWDELRET